MVLLSATADIAATGPWCNQRNSSMVELVDDTYTTITGENLPVYNQV